MNGHFCTTKRFLQKCIFVTKKKDFKEKSLYIISYINDTIIVLNSEIAQLIAYLCFGFVLLFLLALMATFCTNVRYTGTL